MKKCAACIIFLVNIFVLSGCSTGSGKNADISAEMENLYKSNFTYQRTDTVSYKEEKAKIYRYKGEITCSPYVEHIEAEEENLWQEVYYYCQGDAVIAKIKTDGNWQEQAAGREYFYGYGEDIVIVNKTEQTIDGMDYLVYETEYTAILEESDILSEPLQATVKQEYYLEKAGGKIFRIVTDITDLQKNISIINDMSANGTTYENARQNAEKAEISENRIDIQIQYEGSEFQIEIP